MEQTKERPELISRREAILRVSAMLGGVALVGQAAMLSSRPANAATEALFSDQQIELLDDIADTILPETGTPGARAAAVGPFIAMMVADCYYPDDQQVFSDGLQSLQSACREMHGADFGEVEAGQRLALLEQLDAEQHEYMRQREDGAPAHYFRMMKELTMLGYFTSEVGMTQALRYVESPGRFDPCVDMEPGERFWADHA